MKKTKKILMTAIAGLTATQSMGANVIPVFATESNMEKEDYKQELSKKEQLEQKIVDAKKNMDEKELLIDSARGAKSVASKQLELVQDEYDRRNQMVQQNQQKLEEAMNELQPILNEIESLEKQIHDSKKNLEEQTTLNEKASADLEQAQKDLEAKKLELNELQNTLSSLGDVNDLMAAVENAKKEKETAENTLSAAQNAMDSATGELESAKADVQTKSVVLEKATNAYNDALLDVEVKTKIVAEKQAIVDQFIDENGIENAKTELEAAKAELVNAQENVVTLTESLSQAQAAYENAVGALQSAQTNYDTATAEWNAAQVGLKDAQQALDQAQTNYDANQKKIEAKKDEINALNAQIQVVQTEVDQAQLAYDKALNDYNSTTSPLDQAKKNLADFEAKYETELNRLTTGSQGYFESLGCYDLVKEIFNVNNESAVRAELASYTNMGQAYDATGLENMKASIEYLKEYDKLRQQNGLSTPKVSMIAMAIAQVNANYAQVEGNHSGVYGYSENLAWGYGEANTSASPFRGWYDYEKKEFEAGNHKFFEVGHYLNIVNPEDETTGFALQKGNGVYTQEFGYFEEGDVVMTISEFEQSFNHYYNNLKSVESEYNALKAAVKNASKSDTKDDTALKNAEALLNAKKQELIDLQNRFGQLKNEKDNLETKANEMQNTLVASQTNVQNAKNTVDSKKAALMDAEQALMSAKSELEIKLNTKASVEKKRTDANDVVKSIQNKIHTLKDDIENWDTNKAKAQEALQDAKEDLEAAKTKEAELKESLKKANAELDNAKASCEEAQAKKDQASAVLEVAQDAFNTKVEALDKAQIAVDNYNVSVDAITKAEAELKNMGFQIDELKDVKASTSAKMEALQAKIETLNISLTDKKVQALPYEQAKAVLNDVMDQGSKADLSGVENEKLHALLKELAVSVDAFKTIQEALSKAKENYVEKYNLYLDAKEALLNAKSEYKDAMQQLNGFLNEKVEKDEEVQKSDSVNTGVALQANASAAACGLALAGMAFVESKRRKKVIK